MPLIRPPIDDNSEPVIEQQESELSPWEEYRRIVLYLDIQPWICPVCQCTNFGRNLKCAYCWGKNRMHTPRPKDFVTRRKDA